MDGSGVVRSNPQFRIAFPGIPQQPAMYSQQENQLDSNASRVQKYQEQIDEFENAIAQLSHRWQKMSLVRGCTFLFSVALLIFGFATVWDLRNLWFLLSAIVFIVFLVIAYFHEGIEDQLRQTRIWLRLNRWSLARLNRDWDQLKLIDVDIPAEYSSVSNDLDLFGRSSLFQLIGGVETPLGIDLMRDWIVTGAGVEEILSRQEAISELRGKETFRTRLRFSCHVLADGDVGPASLLRWAEAPQKLDRSGILTVVARILAVLMLVGLAAVISGMVSLTVGGPYLIIVGALNFLMTVVFAGRIHSLFNQVSTRHGEIDHYISVYQLIEKQSFNCDLLSDLKAKLFEPSAHVVHATHRLGKIAWQANLRRHGLLFFAYILFQFLFLWDFHILSRLQKWKKRYGSSVRGWFSNLANWEVLAAMAQFSIDHPEWCFPSVVHRPEKDAVQIDAKLLGHPLISHDLRVCNDVQVGPCGSVLLVTGSNMSGKSTLLRSIGLNTVLAQMGGPVCSEKMSLSPLRIETSMRIQDSLADGVSFFMAELKRLKQIVDIAATYEQDSKTTVLFLLDEILQGTNSRERHIAVTRVIRHLIDHHAIGAVSTHDLELGKTRELDNACRPVHFRESFQKTDGKKVMTFDYRIHQGIATTTNALELLKLVGLDEPSNPQSNPDHNLHRSSDARHK